MGSIILGVTEGGNMGIARWWTVTVILLEIQLFPLILTQTPSLICDSTCFGIPLGQIGCRLASQPGLPRFKCTEWKSVLITETSKKVSPYSNNPKLGEICVKLEPISEERSFLGHSSRQSNDGQEGIGDVYAKAKAICENFPGGSLFNPKVLFEKRKCTVLHMDEKSELMQDHIIYDIGDTYDTVQNALAQVLPPDTQYYVDAMKNENLTVILGSAVYSYEDTEGETQLSKGELHHKASSSDGNCLTYSSIVTGVNSDNSQVKALQSVGVDCDSKLMPLCFREVGTSDLTFINEQCGECDDLSATPTCNKWVDLEDCYEEGDSFKVEGWKICTDVCGPAVRKETAYCSSLDPDATLGPFGPYLFNYASFAYLITTFGVADEEAFQYLGAKKIEKLFEEDSNFIATATESFVSGNLDTSSVLYVDKKIKNTLTLDTLLARVMNKAGAENETFWADLREQDFYCYDPCPALGDCCSITEPLEITTTTDTKISENSEVKKYSWQTWVDYFGLAEFSLVENYKPPPSNRNFDCGILGKTETSKLKFWRENCNAEHKPLCMKYDPSRQKIIRVNDVSSKRKRKNKKKKKKKARKAGKGSSRQRREGRQLTDTGRPIEMCATILPALLGVCYFWPSICSNTETTTTEQITEVPDYYEDYEDYEEYDYDSNADNSL